MEKRNPAIAILSVIAVALVFAILLAAASKSKSNPNAEIIREAQDTIRTCDDYPAEVEFVNTPGVKFFGEDHVVVAGLHRHPTPAGLLKEVYVVGLTRQKGGGWHADAWGTDHKSVMWPPKWYPRKTETEIADYPRKTE
jgi:hypothetical protein